jgi:hypothetical protein
MAIRWKLRGGALRYNRHGVDSVGRGVDGDVDEMNEPAARGGAAGFRC